MVVRNIAFALIFFLISQVHAEVNEKELSACKIIGDSLKRLECYDDLAERHQIKGIQTTDTTSGKWRVNVSQNPLDDSKTVVAILSADTGANYLGKEVVLVVRCKSNTTEMYIDWQDFLADNTSVTSRIGKEKSRTYNWQQSSDSQATFHPNPINHLRDMFGQTSYVAQIQPYNDSPTTAMFNITGINDALKPVMETCGWSAKPRTVTKNSGGSPQEKSFQEEVFQRHSAYVEGLRNDFSNKTIIYENTELQFLRVELNQIIHGCTSSDPVRVAKECIKIRMKDLFTSKENLYSPDFMRQVGYKVK